MMKDARVAELAAILVDYSTGVQPGDVVLVRGGPTARPLITEVYRLAVRRGAHPFVQVTFGELGRIFVDLASEEQLDFVNPIQEFAVKNAQVLIDIGAPENTQEMQGADPRKLQRRVRAHQPLQEHVLRGGVRWVGCQFPSAALAQEAGMPLEEYADFLFGATNIDWRGAGERMQAVRERFDAAARVRLVGEGTDLTFGLGGRTGIVCDGRHNMPDGEVFYAPVEGSMEGAIQYEYPARFMGREAEGVRLVFKEGRVVEASAGRGEDFLKEVLETDEGARVVGEFGIGCNPGITRYTRSTLFDEKIAGTVHLALGSAYPESGGTNHSAVHWDMVKDLRPGGRIYLDGELVQEDGVFVWEKP